MSLPLEFNKGNCDPKKKHTLFDFRLSKLLRSHHLDLCFYEDEYREQYKGRQNKVPHLDGTH